MADLTSPLHDSERAAMTSDVMSATGSAPTMAVRTLFMSVFGMGLNDTQTIASSCFNESGNMSLSLASPVISPRAAGRVASCPLTSPNE